MISKISYRFAVSIPATLACDPPITVNLFGNLFLIFFASSIALASAKVVAEKQIMEGFFLTIIS